MYAAIIAQTGDRAFWLTAHYIGNPHQAGTHGHRAIRALATGGIGKYRQHYSEQWLVLKFVICAYTLKSEPQ